MGGSFGLYLRQLGWVHGRPAEGPVLSEDFHQWENVRI